ncbi:hypothetical protein PGIGA_G00153800 [Pangasianodon gigas]|uniref:Uncharacterized protein n=1 Tax=Pangasianodon gigas TaxID=30993 RepID=A0ACC5XPL0_PANGG|nr:hypothetical protein [Pangasianodon gigas]
MANVDVQSMWERHAARRTFPLLSRTKVCRNLFGPVDHEELSCEMKRRLQEISERDQSRWNFNFEENVPLPGHYEWEEIAVSAVPSFYKESVRNGRARAANAEASTEGGCGCKTEAQRSSEAPSPSAERLQEITLRTLQTSSPGGNGAVTLSRQSAHPSPPPPPPPPSLLKLLHAKESDDGLH